MLSGAILVFGSAAYRPQLVEKTDHEPQTDIFALFDLAAPESGPFPSDIFTVEDGEHGLPSHASISRLRAAPLRLR